MAFCFTLAEGSANDWSTVYLRDSLGAGPGASAAAFATFAAALTAGRLCGDRLRDRFGGVPVFSGGAVIAGLGFGAALLVPHPAAGFAGLALLGAGVSVLLPLALSAAGQAGGDHTARSVVRVSTLGYLGSFAGPAIIGGLAGHVGLRAALALPAALVLITAFGARAVRAADGRPVTAS
jgi:MFS family permease